VTAPVRRYLDAIAGGITRLPQRESIAAVGITTQGETLIPVDQHGSPLCDAIVWLDSRAGKQAAALREKIEVQRFYETTGLPDIGDALPLAKLQWVKEEQPDLYRKTHHFLLLEDYLLFWLTGKFVTEKSLLTSTGWFDIQKDCYWEEALTAAGIGREKLPEALECGTPVGKLLSRRARELSLPENITVVTGAMDQTAAALAAGGLAPGIVTETTGTALVMTACTDRPVFRSDHRVTVYRHAVAGQYLYLPIGNTAGMALKWFKNEFCRELPEEKAYAFLDEMAETIPCGCEGLTFLPYLSGCVDPDFLPNATGCFFGIRLSFTRAHFARAVMEAIGYQVADFLQMLEGLNCPAKSVVSLGGGAHSRVWMQMKADICERPFTVPDCTEAASTGAALLAAWGSGFLKKEEKPALNSIKQFVPRFADFDAYRKQKERVKKLYRAVKPLYETEKES